MQQGGGGLGDSGLVPVLEFYTKAHGLYVLVMVPKPPTHWRWGAPSAQWPFQLNDGFVLLVWYRKKKSQKLGIIFFTATSSSYSISLIVEQLEREKVCC